MAFGATDNVLLCTFFKQLLKATREQFTPKETFGTSANGTHIVIYGNITLHCRLHSLSIDITFKAANIADEAIWSTRFFNRNSFEIIVRNSYDKDSELAVTLD